MAPLDRDALFAQLAAMPDFLRQALGDLPEREAMVRGPDGTFSPVEQCWHLADLEREGYAVRIRRLLTEVDPALPDFDGARVAAERKYHQLSLAAGLAAFHNARAANLKALRAVSPQEWTRSGRQEGVGVVCLHDIPRMMVEHDAGHRHEIDAWLRQRKH